MNGYVRRAVDADVPRIVKLSEQKRLEYQEYQPKSIPQRFGRPR